MLLCGSKWHLILDTTGNISNVIFSCSISVPFFKHQNIIFFNLFFLKRTRIFKDICSCRLKQRVVTVTTSVQLWCKVLVTLHKWLTHCCQVLLLNLRSIICFTLHWLFYFLLSSVLWLLLWMFMIMFLLISVFIYIQTSMNINLVFLFLW